MWQEVLGSVEINVGGELGVETLLLCCIGRFVGVCEKLLEDTRRCAKRSFTHCNWFSSDLSHCCCSLLSAQD